MKQFQQQTVVHNFESACAFCQEFSIGEGDFILASKSIYEEYFAPYAMQADAIFRGDFGKGEPNDEMIDKIINCYRKKSYQRIIAIGGGSVIDIAKLLILKDVSCTLDIFEKRIPFIKQVQLIAVPTTCGSGSEVSRVSIAEIKAKESKMGVAEDVFFPDHAIIIPQLLEKLPYHYFINSAIDALIHAMESFVSPKSNQYTELFSIGAIQKIVGGFLALSNNGADYRMHILGDFATASNYAGIAFGNTGTGAVHALSYPLSGVYHVEHGEANYQFFTEVFRFYTSKNPQGKIARVNEILATLLSCSEDVVYDKLEQLLDQLQTRKPLHEYGMREEEQLLFTDAIIETQQRLLSNAYVPLSQDEIIRIYRTLY